LDHDPPSGWKTYYCGFWIESNANLTLSSFGSSENEGANDTHPSDLKAQSTDSVGLYVTTDQDVNYPVDIITNVYDFIVLKGVPFSGSYGLDFDHNLVVDQLYFEFTIPEAMNPGKIVLPNNGQKLDLTQSHFPAMPTLQRNVIAGLPEISTDGPVSISWLEPTLSTDGFNLYLNLNSSVTNNDKTSQQNGYILLPYQVYDPRGDFWNAYEQSAGINWNLAPLQSTQSKKNFYFPMLPISDTLYLIPTADDSDDAYSIDTRNLKVENCYEATPEELKNTESMYPYFRDDEFRMIDELNEPGEFHILAADSESGLYRMRLPVRKMVNITLSGQTHDSSSTVYFPEIDLYYPNGTNMYLAPSDSGEKRTYSFYSLCNNYYARLNGVSVDEFDLSISSSN
jgi:hypothetical protein